LSEESNFVDLERPSLHREGGDSKVGREEIQILYTVKIESSI